MSTGVNRQRGRPFSAGWAFLALVLCASQAGCQFKHWLTARSAPPSVLPPEAGAAEIVDHLNGNIDRLAGWRSTDVRIWVRQQGGIPVKLSSQISVERPRNFRLTARSAVQNEVDLGANDQRFWFWMNRGDPPGVFTCRHEDAGRALRDLPIPFQPDWVIEALGVVPLDDAHLVLHRHETEPNLVSLVSDEYSPQGRPVRKQVVVDLHRGVIQEYVLYDARGSAVARAVLSEHRTDPPSGVTLPHRIDLEWPAEGVRLSLDIRRLEVNPQHQSAQLWSVPHYPGIPEYDLGELHAPLRR